MKRDVVALVCVAIVVVFCSTGCSAGLQENSLCYKLFGQNGVSTSENKESAKEEASLIMYI